MTRNPRKVLLTGFGPFPEVPYNASCDLIVDIAEAAQTNFDDISIETLKLPTDWQIAPKELIRFLNKWRPDLVLQFGVSSKTSGFEIETRAANMTCQTCDVAGQQPTLDCLQVGGPDELPVRLDANSIVSRLRQTGLAAAVSTDAGAYLCNAALYHSLLFAEDHKQDMQVGFIHVPQALARLPAATPEHSDMTWSEGVRGGVEIIAACLKRSTSTRSDG